MQSTEVALKEFGASFLAPAFLVYARSVETEGQQKLPVCLAREGWSIKRLLDRLAVGGLISLPQAPVYLKVSRTLLFRANLGEAFLWPLALGNEFKGTLLDLMRKRFGLQMHEVITVLPTSLLETSIKLPSQQDEVIKWLEPYADKLRELVAQTRAGVMSYLEASGLINGTQPLMLDLGYSGTIQKLLTRMLGRDTSGLYFIATKPGDSSQGQGVAHLSGVLHQGVKWGEGNVMLERSLLLESLLTAPHGQVVDVRQDSAGEFSFFYGRQAATQRHFHDLRVVFDGAIEQVENWMRAGVTFSVEEVDSLFRVFATRSGAIPRAAWHLFNVDDDISGHGMLNPLGLFGL